MPKKDYSAAFTNTIAAELKRLQAELTLAANAAAKDEEGATRGGTAPAPPTIPAVDLVDKLSRRIDRLEHVRYWIDDDHELVRLIDDIIGQQVKVAERRQNRRTIVLNVVFLVLGWLLSLLGNPQSLFNLFKG